MDRFLKILSKVGAVLFVLSFVIISGFVAILIPATSKAFYRARFTEVDSNGKTALYYVKRNAYSIQDEKTARFVIDMTEEELVAVMLHAVRYCLYLEDDLNPTVDGYKMQLYRADEISHMQDVKKVFGKGLITVFVSVVVFIATLCLGIIKRKGYYTNCRKVPIYTLIGVVLALFITGVVAITNFDKAFDIFHKMLFDGNWEFETGVMIKMIGYIFDDILPIILTVWLSLLALFGVGLWVYNHLLKNSK
ncbi:MAG: DUF1461 domain-containing protein [Clostridia bacterium]|nr:DUF1461 domain-containing protein [Clostridia bacterium]